jgi:hypothetical protein
MAAFFHATDGRSAFFTYVEEEEKNVDARDGRCKEIHEMLGIGGGYSFTYARDRPAAETPSTTRGTEYNAVAA